MSAVPVKRWTFASRWQSLEAWVGTRSSAAVLFGLALASFGVQSLALPAYPGRDMVRYVQTYVQYWYADPVLPSVLNTRGPLSSLGVALPLELGGAAAEIFLALLYAASIVAWGYVALTFGPRAAILTTGLLLVYPGYGILFHALASDALFAAAFSGWAVVLTRSILRPSVAVFLAAGAVAGALVLVRPANQVLVVFALLPLVLRGTWDRRLAWAAAFFASCVVVVQSWYALSSLRHGAAVGLEPSALALGVALACVPLLLPPPWRRRALVLGIPLLAAALLIKGPSAPSPTAFGSSLVRGASTEVFLFRAFEIDRIVSPGNGPASREMGRIVQRELLSKEPYRSYGVDLDTFFSSGSNRVFGDLQSLGGVIDLRAVTHEAIREHPGAFAAGIARTIWELLWTRRIYAPVVTSGETDESPASQSGVSEDQEAGTTGQKRLPEPTEGQPIPASRTGPAIWTLGGPAREVWFSATEHRLVFEDPRDEQRYRRFDRDTGRLVDRIPTRSANSSLTHRLNQASRAFPPPVVWLVLGIVVLAIRRPERSLVALVPAAAGLVVIVTTGLVAFPVAEYSAPVSPAFITLAAVGLVGVPALGRSLVFWRRGPAVE